MLLSCHLGLTVGIALCRIVRLVMIGLVGVIGSSQSLIECGRYMSDPQQELNFGTAPKKRGRPRVHASDSAKTAAFRSRNVRMDVLLPPAIGETLASIASDLDCSRNELLASMVRFALTNRNWRQVGLYGSGKK